MAKATTETTTEAPRFSAEQLLTSKKYVARRDVLSALLEAGKTYTHAEVDQLLKDFYERPVK